MKIVAIIQARMGSRRLPGKSLMLLNGIPVIQHLVERAGKIPGISSVVVATSSLPQDDELASKCERMGAGVFRGSEKEVLDRYYHAAIKYEADVILRITADCPLIEPVESGKVLQRYLEGGVDYVSNNRPPTLPHGYDTEVFSFDALKKTWQEAKLEDERGEFVTPYIKNHPDKFRLANVSHESDYSYYRLTLDYRSDYELFSRVFDELQQRGQFGYFSEILSIFADNPDLQKINEHRNIRPQR